jgi:hypothetical protein
MTKAEPQGFGLFLVRAMLSDCPSPAANEVHDDGDHGED